MLRGRRIYIGAVLFEGMILFINCIMSIVRLWRREVGENIDYLIWMIRVTFIISCIFIPIESAIFHFYKKRHAEQEKFAPTWISRTLLPKLPGIFAALWFLHAISFMIIAGRSNWHQGRDEYMFYLRPGSIIIFLSGVGMEILYWMVSRESNEKG